MPTPLERACANPGCLCQTGDVTCSLWCGALDRPGGERCLCRHDGFVGPLARTPQWTGPLAAHEPIAATRRGPLPRLESA